MLAPAPRAPAVETVPEKPMLEETTPEEEDLVGKWGGGDREKVQKLAKLRKIVVRHAVDHPAALRAMLRKAPESAKPALRKAIAISEAGYEKALRAMD